MTLNRDLADSARVPPFRKNLIINGCFRVWQRDILVSSISTTKFVADRWFWGQVSTAVHTCLRVENSSLPEGQSSFSQMTISTADTSIATTDYGHYAYNVEGKDIVSLGWHLNDSGKRKNATFSFWHSHSKTGTNCVSFRPDSTTHSYVVEYTQSVANNWEKTTVTIPAPSVGTWNIDNGVGLRIAFCAASGATYQTTAGSWNSGNYIATGNQVNNFDAVSNHMRFTGVQLEAGDVATDFEARSFVEELEMCKRYYQKTSDYTTYFGNIHSNGELHGIGTGIANRPLVNWRFSVTMAEVPTISFWNPATGTSGQCRNYGTASNANASAYKIGENGITMYPSTTSPASGHEVGFHAQADAEI